LKCLFSEILLSWKIIRYDWWKETIYAFQVKGEYRKAFIGPRGGAYYLSRGDENRVYPKKELLIVPRDFLQGHEINEEAKLFDQDCTKIDDEYFSICKRETPGSKMPDFTLATPKVLIGGTWRTICCGLRAGIYYFTKSNNKAYITNQNKFVDRIVYFVDAVQIGKNFHRVHVRGSKKIFYPKPNGFQYVDKSLLIHQKRRDEVLAWTL
jgi:hypothetical protein